MLAYAYALHMRMQIILDVAKSSACKPSNKIKCTLLVHVDGYLFAVGFIFIRLGTATISGG